MPPDASSVPMPEHRPALRVAGFEVRTSNPDEMAGKGRIGQLWGRFMTNQGQAPWATDVVGVYRDYTSDQHGDYTLLVGAILPEGVNAPEGWAVVDVPAAAGVRFVERGPMPAAVFGAWQRVGSHFEGQGPHVRAFTVDVEFHRDDGLDIHVATRPR